RPVGALVATLAFTYVARLHIDEAIRVINRSAITDKIVKITAGHDAVIHFCVYPYPCLRTGIGVIPGSRGIYRRVIDRTTVKRSGNKQIERSTERTLPRAWRRIEIHTERAGADYSRITRATNVTNCTCSCSNVQSAVGPGWHGKR